MSERIKIKKFGKFVDIFFGEFGWDSKHWTRLHVTNKRLEFVKGYNLSQKDLNKVHMMLGV